MCRVNLPGARGPLSVSVREICKAINALATHHATRKVHVQDELFPSVPASGVNKANAVVHIRDYATRLHGVHGCVQFQSE